MMLALGLFAGIALWSWALFDCITTPAKQVKCMPKGMWLVSIIFLTWIGALFWFLFGRPKATALYPGRAATAAAAARPRRPSQSATRVMQTRPPIGPDDDPEFLSRL